MRINKVYLTEKKYSFLEIQHDNLKFIKSQQRYFHVQRLKKTSIKYSTNFHLYQKNVSWYHGYNRYYGAFFGMKNELILAFYVKVLLFNHFFNII